jgi:hypothetical protein
VSRAAGSDYSVSAESDTTPLIFATYQRMLLFLFLSASTVIGILLVLMFLSYIVPMSGAHGATDRSIPVFLIVIVAGTIGSFFSALQRLYNFKELPQVLYDKNFDGGSSFLFIYSLVPALVGGIAAAVLYLIFAGGLLSGSFFPAFKCKNQDCVDFVALFGAYGPAEPVDYAKACFWGFVAGFAERFVPDLLNNFAQKANRDAVASGRTASGDSKEANDNRDLRLSPNATAAGEAIVHRENDPPALMASRGMANQTSALPLISERGKQNADD